MWPVSDLQATLFITTTHEKTNDFYVPLANQIEATDRAAGKLRPSGDVLKRLHWDSAFPAEDYNVVYLDRFAGYMEIPASEWKSDTSDGEFIPQHRITGFRKISTGEVVWSREARVDKIFGS